MIRESKGTAILSLILCSTLWSSGGILIKLVSWDPFAIAGIRSLIACVTMFILLGKPKFTFSLNQIMVAVSYSATMILFILANKMTTAANAILLQYTEPIYIIILGKWLLPGEKTGFTDWLVIAGVLGGMVLFFMDGISFTANAGNIIAIFSGVAFALTAIFSRRQKDERPSDSFMLSHLITFVVSIPFIVMAGPPSGTGLIGLSLLGVLQIGVPSILYARGLAGVSAISASFITMLEPVLNPVWVALFLREYPSPRAIVGGCIILACVTLRTVLKSRKI